MQKLRWTERGWSRGLSSGPWNFQPGLARRRQRRGTSRGLGTASSSPLRRSRWWARGRSASFRAHEPGDWRRSAKSVRALSDACTPDLELVSGDRVGGSWSSGLFRREPADKKEKALTAAGTNAWSARLFRIGGQIGGVRAHLGSTRRRLTVEQKEQTSAGGVLAPGGIPQAQVADLMQAPRTSRRKRRINSRPGMRLVRHRLDLRCLWRIAT
jgi:hypothetical protein